MPIQAPQWMDYLNCPVCCREFGAPPRSPVSLGCGHTLCSHCLKHLNRRQCPFDQSLIQVESDELVVNTALLQLAGYTPPKQPHRPPSVQALPECDRQSYDHIVKCMEHLAAYLKYCGNVSGAASGGRLSRPMQRKLVTLLQCAVTEAEGRGRAARAARSLGERTVTELILQHQNPQQLSANLWAAVRARGCQFLGPAMQEEVLKLVLLALEDGSALSRKVLVMFVVQRLEPHFPQASKTSIGHVVQLLYRASCFKVSKRECDSSLMQLKDEFRTYESLRREHDAQIVQIATEAGLRIAPDQWSALLYGDTAHKSHMQSIIDKLQTPQSFAQSVQELFIALQRTGDPAQLVLMSLHLDRLANIDAAQDAGCPSWQQLAEVMTSLKEVVAGLIYYMQLQALGRDSNHNQKHNTQDRCLDNSTSQTVAPVSGQGSGPVSLAGAAVGGVGTVSPAVQLSCKSLCRDGVTRAQCPRSVTCTYTHRDDEPDNRCEESAAHVGGGTGVGGNYTLIHVPQYQQYVMPRATHEYTNNNNNVTQSQRAPATNMTDTSHTSNGRTMRYALPHATVVMGAAPMHGEAAAVAAGTAVGPGGAEPIYYRLFSRTTDEGGAYVPARGLYVPAVYTTRDSVYNGERLVPPPYEYYVSHAPPPPPPPPPPAARYTGPAGAGEQRGDTVWAPNVAEMYGFSDAVSGAIQPAATNTTTDMYHFDEMMNALPTPSSTETFVAHTNVIPFASRRSSPVDVAGAKAVGGPVLRTGGGGGGEGPSPDPGNAASTQVSIAAIMGIAPESAAEVECGAVDGNMMSTTYEDTGLDYEQLEAGLQALERRIDTEFKSTD